MRTITRDLIVVVWIAVLIVVWLLDHPLAIAAGAIIGLALLVAGWQIN